MPIILTYNLDERKINALKPVVGLMGIRIKKLLDTDLNTKIGDLASDSFDGTASNNAAGSPIDDELMVFCGIDKPMLDNILNYMSRKKISVPLKAVMTDTNKAWTLRKLVSELGAERAMIAAQMKKEKRKS